MIEILAVVRKDGENEFVYQGELCVSRTIAEMEMVAARTAASFPTWDEAHPVIRIARLREVNDE